MESVPVIPYLGPSGLAQPIPLERFLPTCPVGVVAQFYVAASAPTGWALDPFGSNPLLDLEAAASGRQVLVACNNPILLFLYQWLARRPEKLPLNGVLSELASQARGSERLETHIKGLYQTRCVICRTPIQADGYLWKRGESAPYARVYHCSVCGDTGERLVSEEDLALLQPLQRGEAIHRGRAISRVLRGQEEDRAAVEEALKVYNPRALYVLFTLLNKLEGMPLTPERRVLAEALMISLLDAGTSLWSWPALTDQPRQISLPAVYYEKNLWTELERSVDLWAQPGGAVELTTWPQLPNGAGICLFPGPIRNLEKLPTGLEISHWLCLPPRPNQAFWTLSALWSAWLWGKEVSTTFAQVLGRRRFDWYWHTRALQQALASAAKLTPIGTPAFLQIGEPSAAMTFACMTTCVSADMALHGLAYQSAQTPIQMIWQTQRPPESAAKPNPQPIAREAIRTLLLQLGEPTPYLHLFTAATGTLAVNHGLPTGLRELTQEKTTELLGLLNHLFSEQDFLRRYEASAQELESGKWGLADWRGSQEPLADRVESEMVRLLRKEGSLSADKVGRLIHTAFPGFLTPAPDLLEFCLNAYADWDPTSNRWLLRERESQARRKSDLQAAQHVLAVIGDKLGYRCEGTQPLRWSEAKGSAYRFYFSEGARVSRFAETGEDEDDEGESVLVLPGSRAALLKFKLLRDPRAREATAHGWHFLKLRALLVLSNRNDLTRASWAMQLDSDPINLDETTQLRIFG